MTLTQSDLEQITTLVTNTIEARFNPRFDEIVESMQIYSVQVGHELTDIKSDIAEIKNVTGDHSFKLTNIQVRLTNIESRLTSSPEDNLSKSEITELKKRIKALEEDQETFKREFNSLTKP